MFGIVYHQEGDLGIMLGINASSFNLSLIVEGDFLIKFQLSNKIDKLSLILMCVYGPTQQFKSASSAEPVRTCQHNFLPTQIGGDSIYREIVRRKIITYTMIVGLFFSTLSLIVLILERLNSHDANTHVKTRY
jgi:uncharacterized membrane protein